MAANKGYFGVCPNCPADFKVAGNVTVAGGAGLATFVAAQTHALMGVGARVTYNGGASIGYVASKVDQSNWYLVDANGVAMPNLGATAVVTITHPFASLSAAEAGYAALTGNASLVATNQDVYFPCYCEQATYVADTTAVIFDGPTCDATHEIFCYTPFNLAIECNFNHRNTNSGLWNVQRYRLETNPVTLIDIEDTAANNLFIHILGLQIYQIAAVLAARYTIRIRPTAGSRTWIEQCIIRCRQITGGNRNGITMDTTAGSTAIVKNSIFYPATSGGGATHTAIECSVASTIIVTGCAFVLWDRAINISAGAAYVYNSLLHGMSVASVWSATSHHDFNVYSQDESENHGKLTTQVIEELLTAAAGFPDTWVFYPLIGSDLIGSGIKLRDEDSADLDHPEGYRLVLETHPIKDYEDGETFLPTDFLNPRARWDVGAIAYYPQDKIMYGICPNSGGDFKVAGRCAMLDGIMYTTTNQNHVLMGIGARVVYDGATIATVVGKLAEDQWMVLTLTGAKPPDSNDLVLTTIQHPFGSMATFEAGFGGNLGTTDLTQAEMSMHGVCYCEQGAFTFDNTAVTFDGTTCDETYQLWLYTPFDTVRECNFPHRVRNGGIWDVTRYRLSFMGNVITSGAATLQFIHFEGLQTHMSSAAAAHITGIYLFNQTTGKTWFNGCIMRVADVNANWLRTAVRVDQGYCEMTNCIAYLIGLNAVQVDFQGLIADADSFLDIYYCTIYGWRTPVVESGAAVVTMHNSAIIGNSLVTSGLTTQDYNVYDINEGETHGHLTVQADNALFTAVAGGRETWDWTPVLGSDLIFRARHFNTITEDLDEWPGYRSQGIAPDCGALERIQTCIPFGICPNCPADIQTGAGNVTTVGGRATFEIPQVDVLMGIGARVDYGAGPAIGYVRTMLNPFEVWLVTGAGAAVPNAADQTVNSIDHPFASQSAAEAGYAALTGNASLVGGDYQLWFPCYCEQTTYTADAVAVIYDGPTCDFGHWIKMWQTFSTVKESIMQHRNVNKGTWDATKYRLSGVGTLIITNDVAGAILFMQTMGMQLYQSNTGVALALGIYAIGVTGSYWIIQECIMRMGWIDGGPRRCIYSRLNAGRVLLIINNIFLLEGITTLGTEQVFVRNLVNEWIFIYQNDIKNFAQPIDAALGATVEIKNNALLNSQLLSVGVDIRDYNLYREVNGGEANGVLTTQTNEELWSNFIAANEELSNWVPAPGSNLIDNGMVSPTEAIEFAYMLQADLDHPFETEWRGQSMPGTDLYDIGPLERKYAGLVQWYNYW